MIHYVSVSYLLPFFGSSAIKLFLNIAIQIHLYYVVASALAIFPSRLWDFIDNILRARQIAVLQISFGIARILTNCVGGFAAVRLSAV